MEILERSLFRVTRDGDLEVADEADDLLEAVELQLRRARFGEVTRLEVSESMSQAMLEQLQQGLRVPDELVYPLDGMLDLADLGQLYRLDRPDLKNDPWVPVARPPWNSIESAGEQFAAIRAGDLLVHHPYDSFAASFESYVDRAAADPEVIAIKSTVYRTSDDTPLVPALIDASERGKQTRLSRRDQGARRRAPQHRVVARARAGRRPRRLRLPRAQDPREDDARRAARGGRPAPLRPSRHRQLQRRHRPQLRGLRALHRRRGDRRRRRRPLQPPDRVRAARAASASCSWRRSRSANG